MVLGAARRAELISVVDCSSRVKESKAGGELILIVSLKGKRVGNECRPILEAWVTPRLARMSARSLPSRPPYTTKGYFQGALLGDPSGSLGVFSSSCLTVTLFPPKGLGHTGLGFRVQEFSAS